MGIVHLRGLVKNGTSNTIFTLPVGYRPAYLELHAVLSNENIARCDIDVSGNVIQQSGSPVWFCLDGITFRAD